MPTSGLYNKSREVQLAASAEVASSFWGRLVGLMGRKSLEPGRALIIEPASSIHMFFMRFAIDAVFVDRQWRVVHVSRDLRPWRMTRYVLRSRRVIELPAGTCRLTGTEQGDELALGGHACVSSPAAP